MQNNADSKIVNSWSLLSFAKSHGKMQIGDFTNGKTNETFKSCIFTDTNNNKVFVSYSANLGELSASEIAAQKDELQVVELESGSYKLCKAGSNSWQDVDLGL